MVYSHLSHYNLLLHETADCGIVNTPATSRLTQPFTARRSDGWLRWCLSSARGGVGVNRGVIPGSTIASPQHSSISRVLMDAHNTPPVIDSAVVGFLLAPRPSAAATLSLFLPSPPCGQWFISYHLLFVSSSLRSSITFHRIDLRDVWFLTVVFVFKLQVVVVNVIFLLRCYTWKEPSSNAFSIRTLIERNTM